MTGQSGDGPAPRGLAAFLSLEALLYGAVIIPGFYGQVCHPLRFLTILVCALYALCLAGQKRDLNHILLSLALVLTALADFCFEILLDRILTALFLFVLVQLIHGTRLRLCFYGRSGRTRYRAGKYVGIIFIRLGLPVLIFVLAAQGGGFFSRVLSLGALADRDLMMAALMLVYGSNILLNQLVSLASLAGRKDRASFCMSLGFFLFILCDITVAANLLYPGLGLTLATTQAMAKLTWLFYIPSQILFVMSGIFYNYLAK